MDKRVIVAGLTMVVLAVPTAAAASPHHGARQRPPAQAGAAGKANGKAKPAHKVTFVFRGTFTAPGTVTVTSGNAPVRKGGFVGKAVIFDLSGARIVATDTNGDQTVDLRDVKDGDRVLVQARLPKPTTDPPTAGNIVAARLLDQTDQATNG
jgi:hypothetical protein